MAVCCSETPSFNNAATSSWFGCNVVIAHGTTVSLSTASRLSRRLCRRLSTCYTVHWHKQRYRVFVPPFEGLRGNVHGSSMARWKARGQLPISDRVMIDMLDTPSHFVWSESGGGSPIGDSPRGGSYCPGVVPAG